MSETARGMSEEHEARDELRERMRCSVSVGDSPIKSEDEPAWYAAQFSAIEAELDAYAAAVAERVRGEVRERVMALDSYEVRDLPGYGGGSEMKNVGPPRFSGGEVRYLIHGDYLRLEDVDAALTHSPEVTP